MFHTSGYREEVSRVETVLLARGPEPDVAFEDLHGDGPGGVMLGDEASRADHHHCHPERSLLHQSPGRAALAFEHRRIVRATPLLNERKTQHISGHRTIHRGHGDLLLKPEK
jgi:hypothetical protein